VSLLERYLRREDPRSQLEARMRAEGRLPPGQSATVKWPVLHTGDVPQLDPATWDLRVGGLVEQPLALSLGEVRALPRVTVRTDFHCVTRWSMFDNDWEGVRLRDLVERARPRPEATHLMALGHVNAQRYGYSANLAVADALRDDVLLALRRNGDDISAEHGGPARLMVPHLYAWKSVKWVRGFILMAEDRLGYWEKLGYHERGDPFREERFASL
jgi:DMSO/TMAO reductase YedYZ molybdopterin-dependent catalytic subunit